MRARHRRRTDRRPAARRDDRRQPRPHRRRPRRRRGARRPPPGRALDLRRVRRHASTRCARGLLGLGLEAGDRVGLWSPNYAEWTLVQYATAEIGVILVNINPAYRTHELAYALEPVGLPDAVRRAVVQDVRLRGRWSSRCAPDVPGARAVDVLLGGRLGRAGRPAPAASSAGRAGRPAGRRCGPTTRSTSSTRRARPGSRRARRSPTATSSTTATSSPGCRGSQAGDRLCIPVPFYHCFGMVMGNLGCTTHGATMVIPADAFEPTHVLETIEAERCTALYGVPTMFIAELGHPEFDRFDLSSLRTGVMAGSPCPVEVMKACVDRMHMADVTICYGMTETSPVSTQTLPDDSLHHRTATVGRAHPHVEIRIADPTTGETLPRGATGEFCTRGYSVMQGYWNDPERTADAIDAERLDAHRRPRRDGRRRLRQHRRADQGHGDPRRRERLPARDRGVPLHPSRRRGRPGDRRARRALRRGADGVGQRAARRRPSTQTRCASSARAGSPTSRCRATSSSSTSSR